MKITEDTTLAEILEKPEAEGVLKKNGVPCMTCPIASEEINSLQIGQVARIYSLDVTKIIKEINSLNK
jgi:hypothetical protein